MFCCGFSAVKKMLERTSRSASCFAGHGNALATPPLSIECLALFNWKLCPVGGFQVRIDLLCR